MASNISLDTLNLILDDGKLQFIREGLQSTDSAIDFTDHDNDPGTPDQLTIPVVVKREGDTSSPVDVSYSILAGSQYAVPGQDFNEVPSGLVTLLAGESEATIDVVLLDDNITENDIDIITVSLTNVSGSGATLFTPRTARIFLLDDENVDGANNFVINRPVYPETIQPAYSTTIEPLVDNSNGIVDPIHVKFLPGAYTPGVENLAYVVGKQGVIWRVDFEGATPTVTTVLDISAKVNDAGDRGLMSIALHPDLGQSNGNDYIYAFYVVDPSDVGTGDPSTTNDDADGAGNRFAYVSRFDVDVSAGFTIDANSEQILLGGGFDPAITGNSNDVVNDSLADISGMGEINSTADLLLAESGGVGTDINGNGQIEQHLGEFAYRNDYIKVDSTSHAGGGLAFGPDGNLYISIGDGTSFNAVDLRTRSVQEVDSLSGKILRVDPDTGAGLADNPFATNDLNDNASKVYQLGLRNPFSFAISPNDEFFISNTGWFTWESLFSTPVSTGAGVNYGWPYYEGGDDGQIFPHEAYRHEGGAQEFYNDVAIGNIDVTPAWRAFAQQPGVGDAAPYDPNDPFDEGLDTNYQFQAITAGDVFYDGNVYPSDLQNDFIFTSFPASQVFAVDINDREDMRLLIDLVDRFPAHYTQGPDGYIYYASVNGVEEVGRFLIATDGNDTITLAGPQHANVPFDAGAGNDTIIGTTSGEIIIGGLGDDDLTGNTGADTFVWDAFDPNVAQADTITDFTPGTDRIDLGTTGPASFEVLQNHLLREIGGEAQLRSAWNGNLQTTTLTGVAASALGAGDVIFDTNTAGRTTTGTSGGDQLYGGLGDDNLTGGDGADLLVGDAGDDILNGGAGTDRFDGGAGADTFNGGADTDRVDYNVATTLILDGTGVGAAGSSAEALGDTFNSIEHIVGSQLGDTITLDTTVFQVSGRGGDDTLTGSAAANQINGGDGADIINGGGGSDLLFGNAGADNITIISSAPGDRAYAFGGDGNDQIFGGDGNDRLLGEADDDDIDGGAGNDSIEGGSGADDLEGGAGNDRFFDDDGAASGDTYTDTSGFDQIFYSGGGTFDFSAPGADTYTTDIEWVQFTSGSTVTGTANVDRFGGSSAVDTLNGGDGNDWLQGRAGADIINGDGGNDRLDGGSGTDTIRGGTGTDQLTGGADADTFFYAASDIDAVDVINDFVVGTDLIGLDGASFGLTAGSLDPSQFVTDFGNVAGTDATFIFNESLDRLYVDTDGTGTGSAQLMAIFQGDPTLTEDDFLIL